MLYRINNIKTIYYNNHNNKYNNPNKIYENHNKLNNKSNNNFKINKLI